MLNLGQPLAGRVKFVRYHSLPSHIHRGAGRVYGLDQLRLQSESLPSVSLRTCTAAGIAVE